MALQVLRERGYLYTEMLPTTHLHVQWPDFNGYLAHLRAISPKAASAVRNERNRSRKRGVEIRQVDASGANANLFDELARRHFRHKNGTEPLFAGDFFERLSHSLGKDFLLFEAARAGKVIAMLGGVRSADIVWVPWVGFESPGMDTDFTYFNLAYYTPADYAPSVGIRRLIYGNSVYQAKRRRGCTLVRCFAMYRPRSALSRVVSKPFFSFHRAWYGRKLQ
jgi:predicted N-acyltransferase